MATKAKAAKREAGKASAKVETIKGPCYTITIKWNADKSGFKVIRAVYHFDR